MQRPVHDADAVQVARADDDVVVGGGRDERRQVLGIVRQVGVHLADEVDVGLRDRLLQAVDIRAAEPALAGAVHDLDAAGILDRQRIGDRAGAVRRSIVDDQHAETGVREHAAREQRQVVALVVGRDDDEDGRRRSVTIEDGSRAPASAAAETISTGSITGMRNRSWGKNTRPTRIDDAARSSSDTGRRGLCHSRRAPATANGRTSRYGATDATRYLAECTAYDGPVGTTL